MTTTATEDLIAKLEKRQAKEGLSNREFADKLGVSSELLRLTRKGERNLGQALIRGIIRVYPEYKKEALFILSRSVETPTQTSDHPTDAPGKPPERYRGGFLGRAITYILRMLKRA